MLVEGRLEGGLCLLLNAASRIDMLEKVWMKEVGKDIIAIIDIGRVCEILDASKECVVYIEAIGSAIRSGQVGSIHTCITGPIHA